MRPARVIRRLQSVLAATLCLGGLSASGTLADGPASGEAWQLEWRTSRRVVDTAAAMKPMTVDAPNPAPAIRPAHRQTELRPPAVTNSHVSPVVQAAFSEDPFARESIGETAHASPIRQTSGTRGASPRPDAVIRTAQFDLPDGMLPTPQPDGRPNASPATDGPRRSASADDLEELFGPMSGDDAAGSSRLESDPPNNLRDSSPSADSALPELPKPTDSPAADVPRADSLDDFGRNPFDAIPAPRRDMDRPESNQPDTDREGSDRSDSQQALRDLLEGRQPDSPSDEDDPESPMDRDELENPFDDSGDGLRDRGNRDPMNTDSMRDDDLGMDDDDPLDNDDEKNDAEDDLDERKNPISCDEFRRRIALRTIDQISLDISPPYRPDEIDLVKYEKLKERFDRQQEYRTFRNRDGFAIAEGRFTDLAYGNLVLEDTAGIRTTIDLETLGEADLQYIAEQWGLPQTCLLADEPNVPRSWQPMTFTWKASNMCHTPLYFQDVNLERYGHTRGPFWEPLYQSAHFFGGVLVLPYKMGVHHPKECVYTLGYYRPGNCAPWIVPPVPISVQGAINQTAVMVGGAWLIP